MLKHLLTALIVAAIISTFVSCAARVKVQQWELVTKNYSSNKVQRPVTEGLLDDGEKGYEGTRQFLMELGLPERIIEEMSENQLSFFAKANEVAVVTSKREDNEPSMWQTVAMTTNGRVRLYADVEWSDMPEELFTDFLSPNVFFDISYFYENALLYVSYNGEKRVLSEGIEYKVYLRVNGCAGATIELSRIFEGVKKIPGEKLRIHFEIDVFKMSPDKYDVFNTQLFYQHLTTRHDGITTITNFNGSLGFNPGEKSEIHFIHHEMVSDYPLDYFPEGFEKEK